MKSKKSEGSIFQRIRHLYLKFMYTPESVEKIESQPKVLFKERIKQNWYNDIVLPILAITLLVSAIVIQNVRENQRLEKLRGEYYHSELKGDKAQIEIKQLDNLITNNKDKKVVKMAYSELGGRVTYSLTYGIDESVDGEFVANKFFTNGEMVSLLLNGYPNVDYIEMGFDSKEDAYIATQLAVYQLVDTKNYSMKNGDFSLDDLVAINNKDKERCNKIIAKAKEIYDYSIKNPYEITTDVDVNGLENSLVEVEDGVLAGPYTFTTYTDENTIRILGKDYNDDVSVNIASFVEGTYAQILNENKEEIQSISSGDTFYIKVLSEKEVFSVVDILAHTNYLKGRIYMKENSDQKFVTLEKTDFAYAENFSIINNMDYGYATVSFVTGKNRLLEDVYFNIYDEQGTLIENADGYETKYQFALPVGRYTLEMYSYPKGYFFKETSKEFEITKGENTDVTVLAESVEDKQ